MSTPLFVFAPGAGAPSTSAWMLRFAGHLARLGNVYPFDYPYQKAGRRSPDRLATLIAAHEQAITDARAQHPGPVVLVGKSMGSRVGCHVSLTTPVSALVNFGYPLVAAGKSGKVRDQVLRELSTPTLFVQGTRDPLCPLDQLRPLLDTMSTHTELHIVESGDHSLVPTRTYLKLSGSTPESVEHVIMTAVADFVDRMLRLPNATDVCS